MQKPLSGKVQVTGKQHNIGNTIDKKRKKTKKTKSRNQNIIHNKK